MTSVAIKGVHSGISIPCIDVNFRPTQNTAVEVGVDPAKTAVIASIDGKGLNNVTAVRSFVGLCNYYRRFVRGFAEICAPLHALCKTGVDVATESQKPAVQAVQEAISTVSKWDEKQAQISSIQFLKR